MRRVGFESFRRLIDARSRSRAANERGAVLVFVAVLIVILVGMTGLALDAGRGYLTRIHLARAVDAGVLAGARSLRSGQSAARQQALAVAATNGVTAGDSTSTALSFGVNERGENTVSMTASRVVPTTFMRVLGPTKLDVRVSATAAVPPIDLVLVLDQSGSLGRAGVFGDLQAAAKSFVRHFSDNLDQLSLVSFQLRATNRFSLSHRFTHPIENEIDRLRSAGDTNVGEGLRLALQQLQSPAARPSAPKAVVFFTDGRPTAFRDFLGPGSRGQGTASTGQNPVQDRIMATYTTSNGGQIRGYFDHPDQLPTDRLATPDGCANATSCWGWHEGSIRKAAIDSGLFWADQIRREEITIYSIGLGNPNATDPLLVPDMGYLRELANEGGVADPSQPAGRAYFAPTAAELQSVFDLVAQDLVVRLSQ